MLTQMKMAGTQVNLRTHVSLKLWAPGMAVRCEMFVPSISHIQFVLCQNKRHHNRGSHFSAPARLSA